MSHKTEGKSSIEAATEAIAKVNAILIAKGKLKPSQLSAPGGGRKASGQQSSLITAEVEINDVPIGCRNMLTRGTTQEEISKMSGAAVATRGRFLTPEDRNRIPSERALYLSIQATTQEAVDLACGRINEIIANGISRQGPKTSRFSPVVRGMNPRAPRPNFQNMAPPQPPRQPIIGLGNQNLQVLQEKLYIGLEHAPPTFNVKDKLLGPGASFLQHVQTETGAKVSLRGKGSGFIEMNGTEAFEPMHIHLQHVNMMGLQQARELATNLIQTVQQEYAAFQQSLVALPPPNILPQPQYMMPPPPQMVSLAQPPPLLPGQQLVSVPVSSIAPPLPVLQHAPQNNFIQSPQPGTGTQTLPAPGVVLPQLASTGPPMMSTQPQPLGSQLLQPPPQQQIQTFGPPSSGPPIQQYVQTSEQQMAAGGQAPSSQILVSLAPGQQPGQVVLSTGQPPGPLQVSQVQQLVPPSNIQLQQPQHMTLPQQAGIQQQPALAQPHSIMQQAGVQPQGLPSPHQQPGLPQQQITLQQPGIQQQQNMMQPPQPQGLSTQPQLIQQLAQPAAPLSTTIQHLQPQPQPAQALPQAPSSIPQGQPLPQGNMPVPVSWGVTYTTPTSMMSMQNQGGGMPQSMVQQPNQSTGMIMSFPQSQSPVVMTSSASAPVTSAPSGYVYNSGPREEPKRHFTEVKQEDRVPENLLGYEHGPPHLANLVVQPTQPQQPRPPSTTTPPLHNTEAGLQYPAGPQQHGYTTQLVPQHQTVSLQPQQGTMSQQQVHIQQTAGHDQQRSEVEVQRSGMTSSSPGVGQTYSPAANGDQILMPPPPPPGVYIMEHASVGGIKREADQSPNQPGQEPRKRSKGFHSEEDDDTDPPSSMASQLKELKKYSYNQYSSTPQLYMAQDSGLNGQQQFDQYPGTPVQSQPPTDHYAVHTSQPQSDQFPAHTTHTSVAVDRYGGIQQAGNQAVIQDGQLVRTGEPAIQPREGESPGTQLQQQAVYQHDPHARTQTFYTAPQGTSQPQSVPGQANIVQVYTQQPYNTNTSRPAFVPTETTVQTFLQPPPPPPLMEEVRAPGHEDHTQGSDGRGGRNFSPKYVPYSREDKTALFHQPPPPPPPRSFW